MVTRSGWRSAIGVALVAALSLGLACAGTHQTSGLAPYSRSVGVWLAWDADGKPYFEILIRLPWSELQSLRERGDPQIRLIATARIGDGSGKTRRSRSWTQQLERSRWQDGGDFEWSLRLDADPGEQELSLGVLAQGQPFGSTWRRLFVVPALQPESLLIGEPVFLAAARGGSPGDSCCWRVHLGRTYDSVTGPPRIRTALYDFASSQGDSGMQLRLELEDLDVPEQGQAEVRRTTWTVPRAGVVTPFEADLPPLPMGRYALRLEVESGGRRASTAGRFEVGLTDLGDLGAGEGGKELLRLLLSPAEADSLLLASPEEREPLWEAFWRRRDPDPTTPANETRDAMLQRVRYANEHFSFTRSGWRTDRGRVYILQGPPDRVDRLANAEGTDRIERWTYASQGWVFVFIDRDGRGDYRLLRTNAPEF